jgi:hypothetical protein
MESKTNKKSGDENLTLFGQTNKGIGKEPNKGKEKSEELASLPGNKELSKIKCFICHNNDYYALLCLDKKKGRGKLQ